MTKQEKQALRELLHQELDKIITNYYSKIRPKQFEKMTVQFGEIKLKETKNTTKNSTLMFGVTFDPDSVKCRDKIFKAEHLRKVFDVSSITQMENKMIIAK